MGREGPEEVEARVFAMGRVLLQLLIAALLSVARGYSLFGARPAVPATAVRSCAARANAPSGMPAPLGNELAELIGGDFEIEGDAAAEEPPAAEIPREATEEEPAELPADPTRPLISSFSVDAETVAVLANKGISNFTPIQAESFDLLRSGAPLPEQPAHSAARRCHCAPLQLSLGRTAVCTPMNTRHARLCAHVASSSLACFRRPRGWSL